MTVRFDFNQLVSFTADLRGASDEIRNGAATILAKTAFDIERDAKRFVPVDTGFLQSSIFTTFSDSGLVAEVGPTANYGYFVEFGTSRMAPQPYMRPATERHREPMFRALDELSGRALL